MTRLIYVAGSFSSLKSDPRPPEVQIAENIRAANECGKEVAKLGLDLFPIVPHNLTGLDWVGLRDNNYYIEGTKELMRRCSAILVIPGQPFSKSIGTIGEIKEAKRLGIPIFHWYLDLINWALKESSDI